MLCGFMVLVYPDGELDRLYILRIKRYWVNVRLIGGEGPGPCLKEKAYVQKELAAGTRPNIGVPF